MLSSLHFHNILFGTSLVVFITVTLCYKYLYNLSSSSPHECQGPVFECLWGLAYYILTWQILNKNLVYEWMMTH